MDFQIGLVIAGLIVGFRSSSCRGGSLMTYSIMVWYSANNPVGTDLLYAAFTKMGGVYVHHKKNNSNYRLAFFW
jgi:uncharacterized membrane protein YfcA